jgi:flotillin
MLGFLGFDIPASVMLVVVIALVLIAVMIFVSARYKRCPSNRVLVVYGKIGGGQAARTVHGGGVFIIPLIQDYTYLSLEPLTIEIDLTSALSKKNIRVNVPSTFTIGISTQPDIMQNAAQRLLGLGEREVAGQARDIILGQMRLVIATLTIEQINQDRETFLDLVNKNVGFELNKIGLDVINVNIRDITDESGYIEALGQRAAAEAINTARVEVSQAERQGAIGEATAVRDKEVEVARQQAEGEIGRKTAERDQRISVADLEAEGVSGEAKAEREREVVVAQQRAQTDQGRKEADRNRRIAVAGFEAEAVKGENESKAQVADYEATLAERQAEARRRGDVALANASRDVLLAEKDEELARMQKTEVAPREIAKRKAEIDAEAEAERQRRIANGEADAILARYNAEAEGQQAVLEAKALGYQRMLASCGQRPDLAPTLLLLEKMPELIETQVKAIQNLKIDKITVWDSGNGHEGASTSGFLKGLIGSLPPMHELARQAGVKLPDVLGHIEETDGDPSDDGHTAGGTAAVKQPPRKTENEPSSPAQPPKPDDQHN